MRVRAEYAMEKALQQKGSLLVCGIDEVGRGCLAGPLVAAAVVLPEGCELDLYDSKMLSPIERLQLANLITEQAIAAGTGWVKNTEIDENGLAWALREAYERALEDLECEVSQIILDGNHNYLQDYEICETCIKGDQKIACVAAASIMAKVARDKYMVEQASRYPEYGFETNVGYGTRKHTAAIVGQGLTKLHRKSFCSNLAV